jgi:hypothetical protein
LRRWRMPPTISSIPKFSSVDLDKLSSVISQTSKV